MAVPQDYKFTQTHEWFKVDGNIVRVGISQFAADEPTDITYVDLPEVGSEVTAGEDFGEIESVKATSGLFCAVSGKVIDAALTAKGKAMTIAANGRNSFVIRGALQAAQRANATLLIEIAKSEGGVNAYCAVNYWNLARQAD